MKKTTKRGLFLSRKTSNDRKKRDNRDYREEYDRDYDVREYDEYYDYADERGYDDRRYDKEYEVFADNRDYRAERDYEDYDYDRDYEDNNRDYVDNRAYNDANYDYDQRYEKDDYDRDYADDDRDYENGDDYGHGYADDDRYYAGDARHYDDEPRGYERMIDEQYDEQDYDRDYADDDRDYFEDDRQFENAGFASAFNGDNEYDYRYDEEELARGNKASKKGKYKNSKKHSRRRVEDDYDEGIASAFGRFGKFLKNTTPVERTAAVVAVVIVSGAIVTGVFYSAALGKSQEISAFADVGSTMSDVQIVGQSGLVAVADAEKAKQMTADIIEESKEEKVEEVVEEKEEKEEKEEEVKGGKVSVNVSSIKSDLKIKFVGSNKKLVAKVPFKVTVETPDGSTVNYEDDDKDGIIYKKDMKAGTYKVTPSALPAEFSQYSLDTSTKSVKVKDKVEMKAVDVSNEVKKESQINVAKEDTAVKNVVESTLKDTVEYVESEKIPADGTAADGSGRYVEISIDSIPDPMSQSSIIDFTSFRTVALFATETPLQNGSQNSENNNDKNANDEELNNNDSSVNGSGAERGNQSSLEDDEKKKAEEEQKKALAEEEKRKAAEAASLEDSRKRAEAAAAEASKKAQEEAAAEASRKAKEEAAKKELKIKTDRFEKTVNDTIAVGDYLDTPIGDCKITSDNTNVATVASNGDIKIVGKGNVKITVAAYNQTKTISISAKDLPLKNLPINFPKVTIGKDEKISIGLNGNDYPGLKGKAEDGSIVSVSGTDIQGKKAGKTKVTYTANGYNPFEIEVTVVKKVDKNATLTLNDGTEVYVKNPDGSFRKATNADYDSQNKFYRFEKGEGDFKYKGWQTINGKTYYYNKNCDFVTGEQVIQGVKYVFGSDGVLTTSSGARGIDVSKWNGSIDWKAVRNEGIEFVIIRCGYRGSSQGALIEDPTFRTNIKGAQAAGLKVGVYFFTQAVNEAEAVEEASMVIELCKGYGLSFPVYLDVEGSNGRGDAISAAQRTANIKAFCGTIQNAGYKAGVYANKTWFTSKINTSQLTSYKIWLAQYAASPSYNATRYDMWQHTSKGKVSGISGNVDLNILYR